MSELMQALADHYGEARIRKMVPAMGIVLALAVIGACTVIAAVVTILSRATGA